MTKARKTHPTTCIVYIRLSQDRNGDGVTRSLARQERDCRALAKRQGLTVVDVLVDDDRSAFSGRHRPAYETMLRRLDDVDAIVVWKLDRLVRRFVDLGKVIEKLAAADTALVSVNDAIDTTTPLGQAAAGLLAGVAEQESSNTGRRVRAAVDDRARSGRPHGHRRAYGFEKDGVTIIETEAERIREAATRVTRGESLNGIVIDWNARSIPATNGGKWTVGVLRQILMAPRIAGQRTYHGEPVGPGTWAPIIDLETHETVRAVIEANGHGTRRSLKSHLLSGLLACGRCGRTLYAAYRSDGAGDRRWQCQRAPGREDACQRLSISAEPVERLLTDAALERLSTSPTTWAALRRIDKSAKRSRSPLAVVPKIEAKVTQLGIDYDAGLVSRREWLARRAPLVAQIDEARLAVTRDADLGALGPYAGVADPRALWESQTVEQRRAVLAALVESITIMPATKRGRSFDPSRVVVRWRA